MTDYLTSFTTRSASLTGSHALLLAVGAQRPMPELHAQGLSVAAEHGLPPLSPPSPPAMEQPWRANTSSNTSRGAPTGLFGHNGNPHGPRAGPSGVTARGYGSTAPISGSRATAAGHRSSGGVANPAAPSSLAHGRSGGSAGTSPGTQRATGRALARVVSGPRMGSVLGAGAGGAGARAVDAQRQQQQPPRWSASPRGGAPREDPAAGVVSYVKVSVSDGASALLPMFYVGCPAPSLTQTPVRSNRILLLMPCAKYARSHVRIRVPSSLPCRLPPQGRAVPPRAQRRRGPLQQLLLHRRK